MAQGPASLGETLEIAIDGLGHAGQGVGRHAGVAVFVPGALPGERVQVRVRRIAKRHLEADLLAVLTAADERQKPPCILAERCGGCSLQHATYTAQAPWKQTLVNDALQRIGHLPGSVAPIWEAPAPLAYRNRAWIPLERTPDGTLRAGYYRRGSHRIVNMNRCPVLDPRIDALIAPLKADLERSDWPVDVNLSSGGGLRHLGLRVGHHTGERLICLVSSHNQLPGIEELAACWMERWPDLVGVMLNLQPKANNVVMGAETHCVAGRSWLEERFGGLPVRSGADTFFQVNTPQAERLIAPLVEFFLPSAGLVLDAYCGIGTFSLPLAAAGLEVLGLEIHGASVQQARSNAERLGLSQARFEQGDVASTLGSQLADIKGLLVDPPRRGLNPEVLQAIAGFGPTRLAYVSCDPTTLARDLAQLAAAGYRLQSLQPVDFFPQTSHVESLALLRR
jgi:23S rRNA (uracil1939-C5)-methyltransferase